MNDYDKGIQPWHILVGIFSAIALFLLVFTLLGGFGRIIGREFKKYDAETNAQVYDTSRQFQQGINRDLARYCREWKTAEGAAKSAVATLIQDTASTFQGKLSETNSECVKDTQ